MMIGESSAKIKTADSLMVQGPGYTADRLKFPIDVMNFRRVP